MQERVGIYNRCSTEEEAQMNALSIQAAESREIAQEMGWSIAEQYIESESGTTSERRMEYRKLLEDMEREKFDIVMIKSIDRLMRSARDWYIFLDKLTRNHKRLYIYMDHKFYTPDDSFITGIKAMMAEDFSRELSKKIKHAHEGRQKNKSGFNITVPMFGWNKIGKNKYEINEEEAENYRMAFAMVKEGKGFYTIANYMYEKGVRGKKGQRISDVQWRKMILSPRAHGTMILHQYEYDFETKKRQKVPEEEWILVEDALPPIISREYHEEVLCYLKERTVENRFQDYTRDMTKVGLYELSGKLICGECGAPYYRTKFMSKGKGIAGWKCSTAIKKGRKTEYKGEGCNNINVMEEEIFGKIVEACNQYETPFYDREGEIIDEALKIIRKVFDSNKGQEELKKLQRELYRQNEKKQVLIEKLTDQVIADRDYQMFHKKIECRISELKEKIESIQAEDSGKGNLEDRLLQIREALQKGELTEMVKARELLMRIAQIRVYQDHSLEILLDKNKPFFSITPVIRCSLR